ncbi:MAG: STAS domain-containing protein, partial [Chloroflexota bacterium]|nr:STAS domain-containing protein [Chloroflexota bacterium]
AVGGEVDVATAGVLAREIQAALARNAETVVVDLSAVALFAIEGMRVLLDADRRARARGCRLVVIAGAGAARRVLLATDAKRWLPIAT